VICRSLNLLYPPFKYALLEGIDRANKDGLPLAVFETYRSPERQADLFKQGRTVPGRIVTKAMRWMSWHQYGVAADVALLKDGQWSWDFDPLAITKYFDGLPVRSVRGDGPHWEWAKLPTIQEAQKLVQDTCLLNLWELLDT